MIVTDPIIGILVIPLSLFFVFLSGPPFCLTPLELEAVEESSRDLDILIITPTLRILQFRRLSQRIRVGLVDDRQEDVCQNEDEQEVERVKVEEGHRRVHAVQPVEVELAQGYLEVHPQRALQSIVSTILSAVREIGHADEAKDKNQEN